LVSSLVVFGLCKERNLELPTAVEGEMPVRPADSISAQNVSAGRGTRFQVLIGADQAPNFALRRFTMEPGGGMPRHTNDVEHEQYVLRGRARVGIGDEVFDVGPDDVVYIPAGVPHWYEAQGDEPFEFLCVVPNVPDRLTVLDDTGC
jgi:quercetin dioxygenase-like cupin family protein